VLTDAERAELDPLVYIELHRRTARAHGGWDRCHREISGFEADVAVACDVSGQMRRVRACPANVTAAP
jgi:hypothetical protein